MGKSPFTGQERDIIVIESVKVFIYPIMLTKGEQKDDEFAGALRNFLQNGPWGVEVFKGVRGEHDVPHPAFFFP